MDDTTKILVLGFEVPYSDGSGVEYGVRYDSAASYLSKPGGVIEFESVGDPLEFPADRLDWLIDALQRIRQEVSKL